MNNQTNVQQTMSENWDDDFEFNPGLPRPKPTSHSGPSHDTVMVDSEPIPRVSHSSSTFTEDWDLDSNPRRSTTLSSPLDESHIDDVFTRRQPQPPQVQSLEEWAEPGPSTPKKRVPSHTQSIVTAVEEENWDDDFEDKADSPARSTRRSRRRLTPSRAKAQHQQHQESWDDDFEAEDLKNDSTSTSSPKRTRQDAYLESSSDEELGFARDDLEDRTVTARSRRRPHTNNNNSPPPPVPALPHSLFSNLGKPDIEPFPRSPTASVFSVPHSYSTGTAGRNSVAGYAYTSTSHIPLRQTVSRSSAAAGLGSLPPSPPIHRERRRLRKKSRPQPGSGMYENVFELVEDRFNSAPRIPPSPPRTPEGEGGFTLRERSVSPVGRRPVTPDHAAIGVAVGSPPKGGAGGALLSRIGSVKKWGVRRKRGSTTPSETYNESSSVPQDLNATPRAPRPQSSTSNFSSRDNHQQQSPNPSPPGGKSGGGWFFRATGGESGVGSPSATQNSATSRNAAAQQASKKDELRREKSTDRIRLAVASASVPDSPSKLTKKKPSRVFEVLTGGSNKEAEDPPLPKPTEREPKPSLLSAMRRPTSIQPNRLHSGSSSATRHVSDSSAAASLGRSASNTLVSPSVEDLGLHPLPQDGSRRFLGGVRRISLGGGGKRYHRRNKSGEGIPQMPMEMTMEVKTPTEELLPPIELQPPSPPRPRVKTEESTDSSNGNGTGNETSMQTSMSSPLPMSIVSTPGSPKRNTPRSPAKSPGSPQSASLGRSTVSPAGGVVAVAAANSVPRRNSLGDLKIPARISQAQVSLRRDLGMVREFAASVEQLKELQSTYFVLVAEVQAVLDNLPPPAPERERVASPTFFHLPRPTSRARSNTNPAPPSQQATHRQIATALYTINSKYRIPWECAELLIELGGGSTASPASAGPVSSTSTQGYATRPPPPKTVSSDPAVQQEHAAENRKNRERAITLAGDEPKPPILNPPTADTNLAWRASTGRHDLSQRQLVILREMLNNPDGSLRIPEDAVVNRAWRWGDAMSSTITLPSEESASVQGSASSPTKKRRSNKMGMSGLREMLKALKRSQPPPPIPTSSVESSIDSHHYPHPHILTQRRRARTSTGPESIKSTRNQNQAPTSPYNGSSLHKASPRRPSLASIFRIGQKSKATLAGPDSSMDSIGNGQSKESDQNSTTEEEDWDRMDSASDLEHAARALASSDGTATVKGKRGLSPYLQDNVPPLPGTRPVTPKLGPSASRSSVFGGAEPSPPTRSTRLSNVEENTDDHRGSRALRKGKNRSSLPAPSPSRPRSRMGALKSDSVRSAPPQSLANHDPHSISEFKLAMTPENIKPLLENAREVHTKLNECIAELRLLLAAKS